VIKTIEESKHFGIYCGEHKIDFTAIMNRKRQVTEQLRNGVEKLLNAKGIRVIKGTATLVDSSTVEILENKEKVKSEKIIIATGSRPAKLNIKGLEEANVLDSDGFLEMKRIPRTAVIIGGGVIGVEFAQILNRLGVNVTILELMEHLIPEIDKEIALALEKSITEEGINVFTKANINRIEKQKGQNTTFFTFQGKQKEIKAEKIILCVGRKPDLKLLNVKKIGLDNRNHMLIVNDRMETNIPGIYAVGDVVGGIMLAHVAIAEGLCAAQNAMGRKTTMSYKVIPSCIYTSPEVASVGLSEEEAKEKYDIQLGRFPFYGCGKALILNQTYGMVKIVSEKKYGEVLGVHIIGPHATDLIAEAVLGMTMEMTVEELAHAVHPHPTLSEAIMESALSLCGGPIHMP